MKTPIKFFNRVFPYFTKNPWLGIATISTSIFNTLLVIVFPAITQQVVDIGIRQHHPEKIPFWITVGCFGFLAQGGLNILRIRLNNAFEQKVIFALRSDLYAHIQSLPLGWFDNRRTGDIMTCLMEDVTSLERMLTDGVEQGSVALIQVVIVLTIMAVYNLQLMSVVLLPLPFLVAGALIYTGTAHSRYRRQRLAASELNSLLNENIAGIQQIKAYRGEAREHSRFNVASHKLCETTLQVMRAWAFYSPSMEFFSSLGGLLVVAYGAIQVLAGQMELGILVAFLVLTHFLYEPIGRLHQMNQLLQAGRAAGGRIFEILDFPVESDAPNNLVDVPFLHGSVEAHRISFSYLKGPPVLQNISFRVEAGETIALVGPTGAGKTSLISLLVRFYEFQKGELLIGSYPLKKIPRRLLLQTIALVTQESFLFNGSTAENLRMGKPDATEEEMWSALDAANGADFVRKLPKGLYTPVGERGIKLSVGEKQRISIARALLKNPPILILDEATASVDTATERLIQQALDRLMLHRTCFVIAHRLSTVRNANQILVMNHGSIVERGTHAQLLAVGGLYAELCRSNSLVNTGEALLNDEKHQERF